MRIKAIVHLVNGRQLHVAEQDYLTEANWHQFQLEVEAQLSNPDTVLWFDMPVTGPVVIGEPAKANSIMVPSRQVAFLEFTPA